MSCGYRNASREPYASLGTPRRFWLHRSRIFPAAPPLGISVALRASPALSHPSSEEPRGRPVGAVNVDLTPDPGSQPMSGSGSNWIVASQKAAEPDITSLTSLAL